MRIILKKVNRNLPEYSEVKKLYNSAFPADERAPFMLLYLKSGMADFRAVYADNKWIGFYYAITEGDLTYLFYLAVKDSERGKGHGRRIMRAVRRMYEGQRLFLALEPADENAPNKEERIRRREFYKSCGLEPLDRRIKEGPMVYDVMGAGGDILPEEYDRMMRNYLGKILSRAVKMEVKEEVKDEI